MFAPALQHGETLLHVAAGYGHLKIVDCLYRAGAIIDCKDKLGDAPLYWAARYGQQDVVQYLCTRGAAVNAQDTAGETSLHVTARYGHPEVLAHLVSVGGLVDLQDKDGETTLHCACWHGFTEIVRCLCRAAANINIRNREMETPLHVSAVRGYVEIVRLLVENDADIDSQDKYGCPAVHLAARRNHLDIVQYMVQAGCNLDLRDKHGETCLHDACRDGSLSIVQTLFANGCDLNVPNKHGVTPLQLAAKNGHYEVVRCLVIAGADLELINESGHTADKVASMAHHTEIANLLYNLRQGNLRDHYVDELAMSAVPIDRVKLNVCGMSRTGKSVLIDSLHTSLLKSLFRKKPPDEFSEHTPFRTQGINIKPVTIAGAGNFSLWEFSGSKSYYPVHEYFFGFGNAIFLVLFSLRDAHETQLEQVRFWLSLIKSKLPSDGVIRDQGRGPTRPHIILVATRADTQAAERNPVTNEWMSISGDLVLRTVAAEFAHYFYICERLFVLDARASQSREVRSLRVHLAEMREKLVQSQPWMPRLCLSIAERLPAWRDENRLLPVMVWKDFLTKVSMELNPLVSEERLRISTGFLMMSGDVVYIQQPPLENLVILDPNWLGSTIFGPALNPDADHPQRSALGLRSNTGRVPLREVNRVWPDVDGQSIFHLLEHFDLCKPDIQDTGEVCYEFPALMKSQCLYGLWERDDELTVYAGLRLACATPQDIFTPGFFAKLQLSLRRRFCDDFDDQELILWNEGLLCLRGDVQIMVELADDGRAIHILVRGTDADRRECLAHMQLFFAVSKQNVEETCPGTDTITQIMSPQAMKKHTDLAWYEPEQLLHAQRTAVDDDEEDTAGGVLHHAMGFSETLCDVLCCGCPELILTAKSPPYAHVRTLGTRARMKLSRLLDAHDSLGRDWCLLALALGLNDEMPQLDRASLVRSSRLHLPGLPSGISSATPGPMDYRDQVRSDFTVSPAEKAEIEASLLAVGSPTDRVMRAWEQESTSTVLRLVDVLRELGRADAAKCITDNLPLTQMKSDSDVVVTIGGAEETSYMC
eukprot:scpid22953/ scgid4778/ Death-associated protein kinase 1